jgi:hypothetical protein
MTEDDNVLDWDQLSQEDQEKAEGLLKELNKLFKKYDKEKECEDSISTELTMSPESQE